MHGLKLILLAMLVLLACAWVLFGSVRPSGADVEEAPNPGPPASELGAAALPERAVPERTSLPEPSLAASQANDPAMTSGPEAVVYGSLFGPGFVPIAGAGLAHVELVDASGLRRSAAVQQDGSYTLHAPSFGSHWVRASAAGFLTVDGSVELLAATPMLRQDFMLQPALKLRVRVITPDGDPLLLALHQSAAPRGASILTPVAARVDPGLHPGDLRESADDVAAVGRFVDRGLCAESLAADCLGILLLECEMPVWVSLLHHQAVLQTLRVDPQQDEVTFIVSPGTLHANLTTIRLQVVDAATGLPIPAARARLRGGQYSDLGVATDPQGVALLTEREPGRFDLELRAEGYECFRRSIVVKPGEVHDLGTVPLGPEVSVEGTVMDASGQPVAASFDVGVLDPEGQSVRWLPHLKLTSGGDGAFRLEGLGLREYVLRTDNHDVEHDDAWQGVRSVSGLLPLDTRSGSRTDVAIRLRPASVLVLRVAAGGDQQVRFRVLDELGCELLTGIIHASSPRPLGLPAGNYRVLSLDARGSTISEHRVTLGSAVSQLDLTR